ncbi:AAA-like domain-containing protein [Planktothrix sp. FACHB-1355]|uniref:AAA-like domain-containing protein n=1 Tax=Planktothrix sp. FACHB-1355 TaxID=2692854 RepID=UPI0032217A2B
MADAAVVAKTEKHLTDVEFAILEGAWQGLSYEDIAQTKNYSLNYIRGDVGNKLWKKLSDALGEEVGKKNFRMALERRSHSSLPSGNYQQPSGIEQELPYRPLPLGSKLYIPRPPVEESCDREVLKPGSLVRIKAPWKMGKTSLLKRILANAEQQSYKTVNFSLRQLETAVFTDLDKFLRQFCANIAVNLQLQPELDEYWDEALFGSMTSCTNYIQGYLLANIDSPLVLGLDEVERLFEYPEIAIDFFALLRRWHEEANNLSIWQKLRLVVVHSTEPYVKLNNNQSPFNVGLPVKLLELSLEQMQILARHHELNWLDNSSAERLRAMVGGHPYLVQLAIYSLRRGELKLDKLLEEAPTQAGIYNDHLRGMLALLQEKPKLADAFVKLMKNDGSVSLEPQLSYQLESLGLIQIEGNKAKLLCQLYQLYFREYFQV